MEEYIKMPINGYHTDAPVYTILDAEDYTKVRQWKWQQSSKGYARRNKMTTLPDGKKLWRVLQLHRVILGIEDEEMDGFCVDHINGNRLDNRKSNLRIVTLSANSSNRHAVISSTGELCVSEFDGRYIARVQREHESFYLGSFDTVAEASTAVALFDEKRERVKVIRKVRTVEQLDMQGNHVNWYSSNAEAQRRTGINKSNISRCTKGERATVGGFKWRYADVQIKLFTGEDMGGCGLSCFLHTAASSKRNGGIKTMKTGRSLNAVMQELAFQQKAKRDYIAPAVGMRLHDDGHTFEMNHLENGSQGTFKTTGHFHRQIASALDIPARYYDLMQEKKPELLAQNVNSWFADKNNSYMVRTLEYGGVRAARALLSDRYRRIDNLDIASATLPLFAGENKYEVVSCEVTDDRFYLKIVNHRLETAVVPGDYVQAGVVISNSEVCLGSVSVQPLLYRLVCTNGMVVNDLGQRKYHTGRVAKAVEDSFEVYTDETIEAEDKAFLLKLRDTTMAAIEESHFMTVVDKLRQSVGVPITGRVQDVVQVTGRMFGMNENEQDGILKYLIEGGDLSKYGLSNAVTRASQDIESYDRATALEGFGWQVATMGNEQWKEINR